MFCAFSFGKWCACPNLWLAIGIDRCVGEKEERESSRNVYASGVRLCAGLMVLIGWRKTLHRVCGHVVWACVGLMASAGNQVLLATRVLPRAEQFVPHDLNMPWENQPDGLQMHQDVMNCAGRMVGVLWALVPGGIIFTKLSEAANVSPIWVTTKHVDRDANAVWSPDSIVPHPEGCPSLRTFLSSLQPVAKGNQAVLIMNSDLKYRCLGFFMEMVHLLLTFWVCIAPSRASTTLVMLWMIVRTIKTSMLDTQAQQFIRRRNEWKRRYIEVMRGGNAEASLIINGTACEFSAVQQSEARSEPLAHETFLDGDKNRLILSQPEDGGKDGTALGNAPELAGKWAIMFAAEDRSMSKIYHQARQAATAGAVALIVVGDPAAPARLPPLVCDQKEEEMTIPVIGISFHTGKALKSELAKVESEGKKDGLPLEFYPAAQHEADEAKKRARNHTVRAAQPDQPEIALTVQEQARRGSKERIVKLKSIDLRKHILGENDDRSPGQWGISMVDFVAGPTIVSVQGHAQGKVEVGEQIVAIDGIRVSHSSDIISLMAHGQQSAEHELTLITDDTYTAHIPVPITASDGVLFEATTLYETVHLNLFHPQAKGKTFALKLHKPFPLRLVGVDDLVEETVSALVHVKAGLHVITIDSDDSIPVYSQWSIQKVSDELSHRTRNLAPQDAVYSYKKTIEADLHSHTGGGVVTMYELDDGRGIMRGWLPSRDVRRPASQDGVSGCTVLKVDVPPGADIQAQFGFVPGQENTRITHIGDNSPLRAAGVRPGDRPVLVDDVVLSDHTASELTVILASMLGAPGSKYPGRDTRIVFLRPDNSTVTAEGWSASFILAHIRKTEVRVPTPWPPNSSSHLHDDPDDGGYIRIDDPDDEASKVVVRIPLQAVEGSSISVYLPAPKFSGFQTQYEGPADSLQFDDPHFPNRKGRFGVGARIVRASQDAVIGCYVIAINGRDVSICTAAQLSDRLSSKVHVRLTLMSPSHHI